MYGDFSRWSLDEKDNFSGPLFQQGRVSLEWDHNAATQIAVLWEKTMGRDAIGANVAAVPATEPDSFKVTKACLDGTDVKITLSPGRIWADGIHFYLPGDPKNPTTPVELTAEYLGPPIQDPQESAGTIANGKRDAVILEVWEEAFSSFQDPKHLLEPALGGPDTTERIKIASALRLLRLQVDDDCGNLAEKLADNFSVKGKLTVMPAATVAITGDCPVEAGGGYTGFEHYLYRIEIAEPDSASNARFKWSQFNGGLVGRGDFDRGASTVAITGNDQAINHCNLTEFYLEALRFNATLNHWEIFFAGDAKLTADSLLTLTNTSVNWPPKETFFRLWNGIKKVTEFPTGLVTPNELKDGLLLAFDPPPAGNYTPGDYWTFPVRAAGVPVDADWIAANWPNNAPPEGLHYHRVPLAILNWDGPTVTITAEAGQISDCRHIFRPLTNQKVCCSFIVGDGTTSHGDFDSIEEALSHLPSSGGEICLLPGLHEANVVIQRMQNVKVSGCDTKTKVIPRKLTQAGPIFHIQDSQRVTLEHMDLITMGGTAIVVVGSKEGAATDIEISYNRILACIHAVQVTNGADVSIHHNLIRMLDKQGGDVAIYLGADDSSIERNHITVVPAPAMPPFKPPDREPPVDPTDPCAKLEVVYNYRRLFSAYVNTIWALALPFRLTVVQPYQTLSGIQLAAGCERVRVLENTIVGGAGNGITLGSTVTAPSPAPAPEHVFTVPKESRVLGHVIGPKKEKVSGVTVTLDRVDGAGTNSWVTDQDGLFSFGTNPAKFRVAVAAQGLAIDKVLSKVGQVVEVAIVLKREQTATDLSAFGFLYEISIVGNRIASMGLSGIGIPSIPAVASGTVAFVVASATHGDAANRARALLGNPIVGIDIHRNLISGCLLNPFNALREEAASRGSGGISLGLCDDATICENRIEHSGTSGINPVCGIYIGYGEAVEVTHNQILDNGPFAAPQSNVPLVTGKRGGIVLNLVSSFDLLPDWKGQTPSGVSPRVAARIHENEVVQPVGHALFAVAFGPLSCTDNAFSSEISGPSALEHLAGTVMIYNLGGTQSMGSVTALMGPASAVGSAESAAPVNMAPMPAALVMKRTEVAERLLPRGYTLFSQNQSRSGSAHKSRTCQFIVAFDDLSYQGNQSYSNGTNLFSNVLLIAGTLRAVGNRFSEMSQRGVRSLSSLALRMNDTSLNQGDHCIIASKGIKVGNQALDSTSCENQGERDTVL